MSLLSSSLHGRIGATVGAIAVVALSAIAATGAGAHASRQYDDGGGGGGGGGGRPVKLRVITPESDDRTSSAFGVDITLRAKGPAGNALLSQYQTMFVDPTGPDGKPNPAFHPGHSTAAPGLVVTLSTTPDLGDATPLRGPNTNLAGVFQNNSVTSEHGTLETWNDWQVTSPGFFGRNRTATLTAYVVRGTAPDVVPAGGLTPVSNVVRETFAIGT